jgi:RNA polymerase sigma-70 factor
MCGVNDVPASPGGGPSAHQVFEILAREHADMLMAFLRSVVERRDAAEDIFQETMIVAWRRLAEYDRSLPFGPWLRGIAGRLAMEERRRAGRAGKRGLACDPAVLEALEGEFRRFERGPADSFRQRVDRLAGCVEKLPPLMREAVEMVYRRGLTLAGIAGAVDATEEAVKKRVQRGRQLLARCLETGGAG